ncbi:hypothetical protein DFH09DRAFT_1083634 [Mycena vulgaris]|nr:hypothetical protein DFH09DRAFT_1083634 [Mycena vulgaris]
MHRGLYNSLDLDSSAALRIRSRQRAAKHASAPQRDMPHSRGAAQRRRRPSFGSRALAESVHAGTREAQGIITHPRISGEGLHEYDESVAGTEKKFRERQGRTRGCGEPGQQWAEEGRNVSCLGVRRRLDDVELRIGAQRRLRQVRVKTRAVEGERHGEQGGEMSMGAMGGWDEMGPAPVASVACGRLASGVADSDGRVGLQAQAQAWVGLSSPTQARPEVGLKSGSGSGLRFW